MPSCWLCEPAQRDDPSLTTNPFLCRKCHSLGSRKLYSNGFLCWERLRKMCLWENKWICPLLCCYVLSDNHKPETVPHPKSMLLQAFTGSIPSNSKSHWSWIVREVETKVKKAFSYQQGSLIVILVHWGEEMDHIST